MLRDPSVGKSGVKRLFSLIPTLTEIVHLPVVYSQNVDNGQSWDMEFCTVKDPRKIQCSQQAPGAPLLINISQSYGTVQLDPDWVNLKNSCPMEEGKMKCPK